MEGDLRLLSQVDLVGHGALFLSGILGAALGLLFLLHLSRRRKKPDFLILNCWFCNEDFPIPFSKRKSWSCPGCEGYNGFSESGDYNTELDTSALRSTRYVKPAPSIHLSYLCRNCELNQCLKVSQLSAFVPQNENNFEAEVEAYEAHLERVYRLCRRCEATLHQKLGAQDSKIRPNLLSWRIESNRLARKREGGALSPFLPRAPSLAKRLLASALSLCLLASYEAPLLSGLLTLLLLLTYNNSGGLLSRPSHKASLSLWISSLGLGALKEMKGPPHAEELLRTGRIVMGCLCCLFTLLAWNTGLQQRNKKKKKAGKVTSSSSGLKKTAFMPCKSSLDDWGLHTSTPSPSIRAEEEDEPCEESNSKYDISSLSIEDNVETEFTLLRHSEATPNKESPFIIRKYGGSPEKRKSRSLLRPATLSPPPHESPSKGGVAKASWVAGGYWHSKERLPSSPPQHQRTLSRSSSQSSGFVSSYNNNNNLPSSHNNSPNLRVIRNTFATLRQRSCSPEGQSGGLFPTSLGGRGIPPVNSNSNNSLQQHCYGTSSSIASSSRDGCPTWNPQEDPNNTNSSSICSQNVSLMDKELTLRVSLYSLILGASVLSNLALMGFLTYKQLTAK